MKKREPTANTTVVREKRAYIRLKFPREMREESPILVSLASKLAELHKKSGLQKPEYAKKIGVSGATFRALRNKSANPKVERLIGIANRLKIPLSELCGAREVRGRLISMEDVRRHMAVVIRDAMYEMTEPDLDKAKRLGVSLFQLYLIRSGEASPTILVTEEMATRLGISLWEFLGVDADTPLRID